MKPDPFFLKIYSIPLILAIAIGISLMNGCSSSTSTNGQSSVTMQSQLAANDVSGTIPTNKGMTPQGLLFDSIVVTNAIVFVSDVKLHSDVDSIGKDDHDQNIKTGPFVIVFDSSGSHIVTTATIPPATYDRIKFEIRKPDKNADAAILTQFPELQNGDQTYSVWIYGYTVQNGVRTSFSVASSASSNLTLKFKDHDGKDKDNIVLDANSVSTLMFQFDPRIVFHLSDGITLIDPRDMMHHQKDVDDNVLIAIQVLLF